MKQYLVVPPSREGDCFKLMMPSRLYYLQWAQINSLTYPSFVCYIQFSKNIGTFVLFFVISRSIVLVKNICLTSSNKNPAESLNLLRVIQILESIVSSLSVTICSSVYLSPRIETGQTVPLMFVILPNSLWI